MSHATAIPLRPPEGFEYALGNSGSTPHLVDHRPRLPKSQLLGDLPTDRLDDELFDQVMLRRDDNLRFILSLPEIVADYLANMAWNAMEHRPFAYLLSLSYEELDWLIARFRSDEKATA